MRVVSLCMLGADADATSMLYVLCYVSTVCLACAVSMAGLLALLWVGLPVLWLAKLVLV